MPCPGSALAAAVRVALRWRDVACLRLLLRKQPPEPTGDTPLMIAIRNHAYDAVPVLLDAGSKTDAANTHNETALSLACAQKEVGVVRLLCQKMTTLDPGINKHVPDISGPVHYICKAKNVEIAKIVLERAQSFDVNRLDEQGRPGPCHLIDGTNPKDTVEILDALVQAGFDVNLKCRDSEIIIQKFIRGIAPNLNAPIVI
jgi:ankyrin repeat protein